MASFRKRGKLWYYRFTNADGDRVEEKGHWDLVTTKGLARKAEDDAAKIRAGDGRELAYRNAKSLPLTDHFAAWRASMTAKNTTEKHIELFANRAARVVALIRGAKLSDIEPARNATREQAAKAAATLSEIIASARLTDLGDESVQKALATLKAAGRSLATCNHHRAAIKAFSAWCYDKHRLRDDVLRGVTGFNALEDRRHDRRTVSLAELRRLIEAAERGPDVMGMSGPARALCYRLAVASGLRYSELASILPESFDWKPPSVTVAAAYTKNGDPATLPVPTDLANDLAAYVAPLPSGTPVFPLPPEKGAKILRVDLQAAGIPYRDASGLVFDFHALRCQTATLADAAGVTPRVVQKMMRHSTLELTGRYTRPRAVDIEAAAGMLPSLKPEGDKPEALAATGTEGRGGPINKRFAPSLPLGDENSGRFESVQDVIGDSNDASCMVGSSRENKAPFSPVRSNSATVVNTGEATRTPDLRIMRPPL